jgi:hypothetical protein
VCAPDDGWKYHPKHVEQFPDINKLCDASFWIYEYIGILLGTRPIIHISRIKVNYTFRALIQHYQNKTCKTEACRIAKQSLRLLSAASCWPLFDDVSNTRFIASLMPPFVNRPSHLQSCGRCLHPCTLERQRPTELHLIKNQLMHLLRKLFYIHIETLKLVKNVL